MNDPRPELLTWPPVSAADEEALVRLAVPYVRWLHPDLVAKISRANDKHLAAWQNALHQREIQADFYVWPGSACVFPGVRRRAGKAVEKELHCFRFDHNGNRLAHRVWELLGSAKFKSERAGYELVHLLPHQPTEWKKLLTGKEFKMPRLREFLPTEWQDRLTKIGMPALFSNPANMCFMPGSMVRPTDNNSLLRLVLWKKTLALYGRQTLLPPGLAQPLDQWLKEVPDVAGLNWSQCFHGSESQLQRLLEDCTKHLQATLLR